jgi:hypothetical protein
MLGAVANKGTWIALGVAAVVILGGGTCFCAMGGGFLWAVSGADQADADDTRAQADGLAAGPGMSGDECVQTAIQRRMSCGGFVDPNCASQATSFVTACLQSSTRVDPALCDGVPAGAGFFETTEYAAAYCTSLGYEQGSQCEDVPPGVAAYCRSR